MGKENGRISHLSEMVQFQKLFEFVTEELSKFNVTCMTVNHIVPWRSNVFKIKISFLKYLRKLHLERYLLTSLILFSNKYLLHIYCIPAMG